LGFSFSPLPLTSQHLNHPANALLANLSNFSWGSFWANYAQHSLSQRAGIFPNDSHLILHHQLLIVNDKREQKINFTENKKVRRREKSLNFGEEQKIINGFSRICEA